MPDWFVVFMPLRRYAESSTGKAYHDIRVLVYLAEAGNLRTRQADWLLVLTDKQIFDFRALSDYKLDRCCIHHRGYPDRQI